MKAIDLLRMLTDLDPAELNYKILVLHPDFDWVSDATIPLDFDHDYSGQTIYITTESQS